MRYTLLNKRINGMTLVELMIVVAILGIISAIAIPSYQNQVRESRRQDGITFLMQLKMQQEDFRLTNNSYASSAQLGNPANDFYTFTASNVTATTFTLTATAKGSQSSDSGCTTLTLDQSMNKAPVACW